jgi:hypothetical protein
MQNELWLIAGMWGFIALLAACMAVSFIQSDNDE